MFTFIIDFTFILHQHISEI